ncbi:hypothetical protein Tco_1382548 [Tanacetum coccineum]
MVTSMGIRHAKPYTLRGGPSTKLEQRLFKAWQLNNHSKNSSISSKPDHAHICTISGAIRGREITSPPGFLAMPTTATMFAATTPENMPLAYRVSTSTNPNPIRNNDLRTELEYFSEDYDEEREMEPRLEPVRAATTPLRAMSPRVHRRRERVVGFEETQNKGEIRVERNNEGGRPSEEASRGNGSQALPNNEGGNLPPNAHGLPSANSDWKPPYRGKLRQPPTRRARTIDLHKRQKAGSILDYEDLKAKFRSHFSQQKKFTKTRLAVHNIKQRENESTQAFITRYTDDTLQILGLHEDQRIFGFIHGLRTRSLVEHLSTDLPPTYKGLMEKTYTWVEAREVATNGVSSDRRDSFKRPKKYSWDNNRGQKNKDRKSAKSFEPPPKMFGSKRSRDTSKYYHFHEDYGHDTNDCRHLKVQIQEAINSRQLSHLVKGIKKEKVKSTDTPRGEGKKEKSIAPVEAPILMISREYYAVKNTVSNGMLTKKRLRFHQ